MKKTIILSLLVIGGFVSAATSTKEKVATKKTETSKAKPDNKVKQPTCTMSCSITINTGGGSTFTVTESAGNWFTSCEAAAEKCTQKLGKKMTSMAFN